MGFEIKDNVLVKYIEEPGVTDIVVPDGVKRIGENAFELCESLTSITIPDSVIEIRDEAFCCCSSLTSVSIPNSVMKIGVAAFYNTPWLEDQKDDYIIAGNNILIKYNGNDENVKIPNGVTMIGHEAFRKCFKLTSITIPHSVTEIGTCAFYGCRSLESVTIPDKVTSIGIIAFAYCNKLVINAPVGSYAKEYAKANQIKYSAIVP